MELARIFQQRKYMWDGSTHSDKKEAEEMGQKYQIDGFETEIVTEEGQYFVFTRRLVTEIKT